MQAILRHRPMAFATTAVRREPDPAYVMTAVDGHGRKCNGFSYDDDDQVCMLSPFGLQYETDYDYYERNPTPVTVEVRTTDKITGNTVITKKEKPVPLDCKLAHHRC